MTEKDKIIIRRLSLSPEWALVTKVAEGLIGEIRSRMYLQDNQWDTLKSVIGNEAEVRGIGRLIGEIHRIAKESK